MEDLHEHRWGTTDEGQGEHEEEPDPPVRRWQLDPDESIEERRNEEEDYDRAVGTHQALVTQ